MGIFTCFACSFLAASLGARVRLHHIKRRRAVVHSKTQVPTPPSSFTIIEKVGEGASGSVYKASTQDGAVFALKMLGPVPDWDSGYQMMGVIKREIKAYTRLKISAAAEHTVAFHNCFCGKKLTVDGSGYGMDYVSTTCIKDDAVDPGAVWLQMSLADASFSSYMKDPIWRKQVMLGTANSPLPVAMLSGSGLDSAIECETLTKGRFIFNSVHSRFIYLGQDGGVWTSQERDRGPFRFKTYVTLADTIEDPEKCSAKWCFQVADREFRSEFPEVAKEFVGKLRRAKVALQQKSQSVPLFEFRQIVRDMVLGLKELADAGVIHGDVKPDNLLAPAAPLLTTDKLQWTDFGFASFSNSSSVDSDSKPAGGTLAYAPPELLAAPDVGDADGVSPVFDVFAVGLIAFELLTGGSLKTCAVDNGKADLKKLILPVGYVQYFPIAYTDAKSEGRASYQNMPLLLQLLQVIGLPQDLTTMMVSNEDANGSIPYGNPYESGNSHGRSQLHMERAIFAINAAITGDYAAAENRDRLVARGLLAEEKYFGTKLQDCARGLLAKHALKLDDDRLKALDLIESMLAVMPSERISADDALKHNFLAALDL